MSGGGRRRGRGINACPCAQGLVRERSADRLLEAGFKEADVERILELVPLATHNQRGVGTLFVGSEASVNAEHLGEIVESSMSAPVFELLKRPDELFVVEHAHLQPRFVEDSVRLALGSAGRLPALADEDSLLTPGQPGDDPHARRGRRAAWNGARAPRRAGRHEPAAHTTLADWLAR